MWNGLSPNKRAVKMSNTEDMTVDKVIESLEKDFDRWIIREDYAYYSGVSISCNGKPKRSFWQKIFGLNNQEKHGSEHLRLESYDLSEHNKKKVFERIKKALFFKVLKELGLTDHLWKLTKTDLKDHFLSSVKVNSAWAFHSGENALEKHIGELGDNLVFSIDKSVFYFGHYNDAKMVSENGFVLKLENKNIEGLIKKARLEKACNSINEKMNKKSKKE